MRTREGDMNETPRISEKELLILELLISKSEMYGLQLVEVSEGRLKRGTVYVTLGRMEDKGFVESRREAPQPGTPGLPRPHYRATGLGQRALAATQAFRAILAPEPAL